MVQTQIDTHVLTHTHTHILILSHSFCLSLIKRHELSYSTQNDIHTHSSHTHTHTQKHVNMEHRGARENARPLTEGEKNLEALKWQKFLKFTLLLHSPPHTVPSGLWGAQGRQVSDERVSRCSSAGVNIPGEGVHRHGTRDLGLGFGRRERGKTVGFLVAGLLVGESILGHGSGESGGGGKH